MQAPVADIVLWLRGAALEALAPVAGIAPWDFVTGDESARGVATVAGVDLSLRRPDVRDDVLGRRPAGEAVVEAGRC